MKPHNAFAVRMLSRLRHEIQDLESVIEDFDVDNRKIQSCAEQIRSHANEWIGRTLDLLDMEMKR